MLADFSVSDSVVKAWESVHSFLSLPILYVYFVPGLSPVNVAVKICISPLTESVAEVVKTIGCREDTTDIVSEPLSSDVYSTVQLLTEEFVLQVMVIVVAGSADHVRVIWSGLPVALRSALMDVPS